MSDLIERPVTALEDLIGRLDGAAQDWHADDAVYAMCAEAAAAITRLQEEVVQCNAGVAVQNSVIITQAKKITTAAAELSRLTDEVERLRADAGRYRWLREREYMDIAGCWLLPDGFLDPASPVAVDAAIDAAIKEAGNG